MIANTKCRSHQLYARAPSRGRTKTMYVACGPVLKISLAWSMSSY